MIARASAVAAVAVGPGVGAGAVVRAVAAADGAGGPLESDCTSWPSAAIGPSKSVAARALDADVHVAAAASRRSGRGRARASAERCMRGVASCRPAPFREGGRRVRTGAGLLASEHPAAPSRPTCQWPRVRAAGFLGHSGGPAPDFHRTSLTTDPIVVRGATLPQPRDVRRPGCTVLAPHGVGNSGGNPGLTRSGMGDDRIAVPLGPAWEGDPGGGSRARTPGRETNPSRV